MRCNGRKEYIEYNRIFIQFSNHTTSRVLFQSSRHVFIILSHTGAIHHGESSESTRSTTSGIPDVP